MTNVEHLVVLTTCGITVQEIHTSVLRTSLPHIVSLSATVALPSKQADIFHRKLAPAARPDWIFHGWAVK